METCSERAVFMTHRPIVCAQVQTAKDFRTSLTGTTMLTRVKPVPVNCAVKTIIVVAESFSRLALDWDRAQSAPNACRDTCLTVRLFGAPRLAAQHQGHRGSDLQTVHSYSGEDSR